MSSLHIRRKIDSETLHLPELHDLIGKTVDIIVVECGSQTAEKPIESLETFFGLARKEAPLTPDQPDALLADPRYQEFRPLLDANPDDIDVEAILALRNASTT